MGYCWASKNIFSLFFIGFIIAYLSYTGRINFFYIFWDTGRTWLMVKFSTLSSKVLINPLVYDRPCSPVLDAGDCYRFRFLHSLLILLVMVHLGLKRCVLLTRFYYHRLDGQRWFKFSIVIPFIYYFSHFSSNHFSIDKYSLLIPCFLSGIDVIESLKERKEWPLNKSLAII